MLLAANQSLGDYTFQLGGYAIGFRDESVQQGTWTFLFAGPLGVYRVPFWAWQGWAIVVAIALAFLAGAYLIRQRRRPS